MPIDDEIEIEQELITAPATINYRRAECSLDDAYIFNYTNNPKGGKTQALIEAGFEGTYPSQEAYRMHNRLRPKIQKVMQEITQDLATLSNQQLTGILRSTPQETGYSAMLAAIKIGFEYSGLQPNQQTETPVRPNQDAIQRRIETLQKQIEQVTGKLPSPVTE